MRNDDYSKPIYSTDEIHCAVSDFHQPLMSEAEGNENFLYSMSMESDMHIPTKPLKNKIVFYKGKFTTKYEITLIPTIGVDINLPQIHCYRSKNLTIRIEWLGFHLFFGWRQTYPKWKEKKNDRIKTLPVLRCNCNIRGESNTDGWRDRYCRFRHCVFIMWNL